MLVQDWSLNTDLSEDCMSQVVGISLFLEHWGEVEASVAHGGKWGITEDHWGSFQQEI